MSNHTLDADVLVLGATGTVGRAVLGALLERDGTTRVRCLVRSDSAAAALPDGVLAVRGDLRDGASVARAVAGVRAVFYASPHEPDDEALAQTVVRACEDSSARLVFVGVHVDGPNRAARAALRLASGFMLPQYRTKMRIAERVRCSRTSPVLLMSPNFYQNDELFRDEILGGVFSQPFSARGINRVDVRDLGRAAARALTDRGLASGAYPVVGPMSFSGPACAAVWSATLGRDVQYTGDDVSRFRAHVARSLSGRKRDDFLATYTAIAKFHLATDPAAVRATTDLLGRPPLSYAMYTRDALARWTATATR